MNLANYGFQLYDYVGESTTEQSNTHTFHLASSFIEICWLGDTCIPGKNVY